MHTILKDQCYYVLYYKLTFLDWYKYNATHIMQLFHFFFGFHYQPYYRALISVLSD